MVKRGNVAIAYQIFSNNAPNCIEQRNGFNFKRYNMREHTIECLFDAHHFIVVHKNPYVRGFQKEWGNISGCNNLRLPQPCAGERKTVYPLRLQHFVISLPGTTSADSLSAACLNFTAISNLFAANCANHMGMGLSWGIKVGVIDHYFLDVE